LDRLSGWKTAGALLFPGDALHYARAVLYDYERIGPGAAELAARARALVADLEKRNP
jgi:hypothetical protein